MSTGFEINAEIRQDLGKGASRRLRRDKKIPAVLYGGGKDAVALTMDHDAIVHSLDNEAFYSHILTINIDGVSEKAVLKDLQRHTHKPSVLHLDLQRVSDKEKLRMHVPLHFIGEDEAPGVKQGGGIISHLLNDVEIACLPKDLPEYLEVDVANLNVGETVHLSDIGLPSGVELVELSHGEEHNLPVVSIHVPRAAAEVSAEPEPAAEADETSGEGEGSE
ncbi:MAG: 50S ribosomal protein L25/general stress protein Ctc [Gammaproteobacteria bacterium]